MGVVSCALTWDLNNLLGFRGVAKVRVAGWLYGDSGRGSVRNTRDATGLFPASECLTWIWNDFHSPDCRTLFQSTHWLDSHPER